MEYGKGPYGDHGSKKYLIASIDQSLKRLNLDYVDIFYHHRPDPETPIEETVEALDLILRQGKALYIGISNYRYDQTKAFSKVLKNKNIKLFSHQPNYSIFDRWIESDLLDFLNRNGIGTIAYQPLAQGLLSNKYLSNIPEDREQQIRWLYF